MLRKGWSLSSSCLVWLVLMLGLAFAWSGATPVFAQEGEGEPAAADNAAAAPAGEEQPQEQNALMWLIETSGFIGLVILIISFVFVQRVVLLFMDLRPEVVAPADLLQQADQLLQKRDYNAIYKLAQSSDCQLGELLAVGMVSMSSGLEEAREAMSRTGDAIVVHMEKRITLLAVIGSLGPMIGLLGTLKGMIASFSVIATSGAQMKASEVAAGISEALVLTFEGVALSLPAIYFYSMFKDRIAVLTVDVQNIADEFIRKVHATVKKGA